MLKNYFQRQKSCLYPVQQLTFCRTYSPNLPINSAVKQQFPRKIVTTNLPLKYKDSPVKSQFQTTTPKVNPKNQEDLNQILQPKRPKFIQPTGKDLAIDSLDIPQQKQSKCFVFYKLYSYTNENSSFSTPYSLIQTEMDKQTFDNQTTEQAQHAPQAGYIL